ncbi:hypothetical protein EDB92DRAFT_1851633 [Lactarius akahatsu]|uniref:Secreted protein n=1 Tax=Lactarius akahatsu TaxID=416441 RepID=A0AAD4LHZ3_9AGAM|nr:hypothetical protein EDB92DRAFT_1851633 [Lactarius akahatsu]
MWGDMCSSGPMGRHVWVRFHRACCMIYLSLCSLSLDVRSAVLEPRSYSAGRARTLHGIAGVPTPEPGRNDGV